MQCSYCNGEAIGLDEDGEPTCSAATCMISVRPLPEVIEISSEDDAIEGEAD